MATKIEKYKLGEKILELSAQPGMTTEKIAEILTEELDGADTISQPTVSRYLSETRKARKEHTQILIQDKLKGTVPKDLEVLEEVEEFFLNIFRGNEADKEGHALLSDKDGKALIFDVAARASAGKDAADIVMKKLRLCGVGTDAPDDGTTKENDERLFDKARSGISGLVGRLREAGTAGPKSEQKQPDSKRLAGVRA